MDNFKKHHYKKCSAGNLEVLTSDINMMSLNHKKQPHCFSQPYPALTPEKNKQKNILQKTSFPSPISTSAYGTDGTTTLNKFQESPSAYHQNINVECKNKSNEIKRRLQSQLKSVRFVPTKLPKNLVSISNLITTNIKTRTASSNDHFYTSAERLAETLANKQRLLQQELKLENQKILPFQQEKTKTVKQPIIDNEDFIHQDYNQPIKTIQTINSKYKKKSQHLISIDALSSFSQSLHKDKTSSKKVTTIEQSQMSKQLNDSIPHAKNMRKSKSPSKSSQNLGRSSDKLPNVKKQELEWVVKRRPDGTHYISRRPVRSSHNSAIMKDRRKHSALRERHQSSALSTTTDDDVQNTMRKFVNEQRRKKKKNCEFKETEFLKHPPSQTQLQQKNYQLRSKAYNLLDQPNLFHSTTV